MGASHASSRSPARRSSPSRGISFCATCRRGILPRPPHHRGRRGDSAMGEAIFLSKFGLDRLPGSTGATSSAPRRSWSTRAREIENLEFHNALLGGSASRPATDGSLGRAVLKARRHRRGESCSTSRGRLHRHRPRPLVGSSLGGPGRARRETATSSRGQVPPRTNVQGVFAAGRRGGTTPIARRSPPPARAPRAALDAEWYPARHAPPSPGEPLGRRTWTNAEQAAEEAAAK